ncbi:MAG TPA: hypothetical protein VFR34_00340, partial [Paracoccaceae bacterium]|nr:hypothetical protein [Paracoccaceae bacterium]
NLGVTELPDRELPLLGGVGDDQTWPQEDRDRIQEIDTFPSVRFRVSSSHSHSNAAIVGSCTLLQQIVGVTGSLSHGT